MATDVIPSIVSKSNAETVESEIVMLFELLFIKLLFPELLDKI